MALRNIWRRRAISVAFGVEADIGSLAEFDDLSKMTLNGRRSVRFAVPHNWWRADVGALDPGKRDEIVETIRMLTGNLEKIVEHGRRADGIVRSMLHPHWPCARQISFRVATVTTARCSSPNP
jgi:hypothetical protein